MTAEERLTQTFNLYARKPLPEQLAAIFKVAEMQARLLDSAMKVLKEKRVKVFVKDNGESQAQK